MRRELRLAAILGLGVLALGLCVHYGAVYDERWPHPTGDQLAENPGGWDGERVLLFGDVEMTAADGELTMTVETDAGEVARVVVVRGAPVDVEPGGVLQVYGELSDRGTVQDAERVVVVNATPRDQLSKLGLSVLGVLAAAVFFLRHWRIDVRQVRFVDRGGDRDG